MSSIIPCIGKGTNFVTPPLKMVTKVNMKWITPKVIEKFVAKSDKSIKFGATIKNICYNII